jgi:uncharacterized protein YxeA
MIDAFLMHKKRKFLKEMKKVIAKRRKFIITGVVILAMIAVICIVIAYSNSAETDYVFEGTFVKTEESIEVVDTTNTSFGEQGNTDEIDKDSFKRKSGDCVFV